MLTMEFSNFADFCSFSVNEDKLQNESIFKITAKVCDFGQNLKSLFLRLLLRYAIFVKI